MRKIGFLLSFCGGVFWTPLLFYIENLDCLWLTGQGRETLAEDAVGKCRVVTWA